jgi:hypothetical protein
MSKFNFKIKHLKLFLDGKFDLIPKGLGVELVDLGMLNYLKITPENYNYWWYEVDDKSKIDKNKFTYNWSDLIPTRKMQMVNDFIKYHNEEESMYKLMNAILIIESARFDGIDINTGKSEFENQIDFYYGKDKKNHFTDVGKKVTEHFVDTNEMIYQQLKLEL